MLMAEKSTLIKQVLLSVDVGETCIVNGWLRTRRDSKGGFSFLEINDGSCFENLQVVADQDLHNYHNDICHLHPGASVSVIGLIRPSPGKNQRVEMHAQSVCIIGSCDVGTYPLQKQRISFEKLRDVAHLRARTNTFGAVARVRNALSIAAHAYFQKRDFCYLNTPVITTNDCEGAGQMFQVTTLDLRACAGDHDQAAMFAKDFFGQPAYLTVSGQLEAETYACGLGRVYTFGPTFRAENSNTSRHLAEFWMIEPEMAFADLADDIELAEGLLKHLCRHVLSTCQSDLAFFCNRIEPDLQRRLEAVVNTAFETFSYDDAIDRLLRADVEFEFPVRWGMDLQAEHERFLSSTVVGGPLVVIDFPRDIKPFYMRLNPDERTVASMDVLLPGIGEIIGGSQREERLEQLDANFESQGLDPDDYWWYRDLRRFGSVPHAGFGLGFERAVQFCTGMTNIRDVIPFPRTPRSARF